MSSRQKAVVLAVTAVILGGALGLWLYDSWKKRTFRAAVVTIVQDASLRLRESLTLEAGLPAEGRMGTARQVEQHAVTVDQGLQQLKSLDGRPDRKLADAADAYLVNVREILRNQAASNRHRASLTASLDALRAHMRADDRTGNWVTAAVVARERVDADYRNYRIATEAFGTVLDAYGSSEKKIAPYVDAALLSDARLLEETRSRTIQALGDAAAEMQQVKQLVGGR